MPTTTPDGIRPEILREIRTIKFGDQTFGPRAIALKEAAEAFGDVLEVGFGIGTLHKSLHENPRVKTVTIIEKFHEVLEAFKECDCDAYIADALPGPPEGFESFDTVILDVWPGWPNTALWKPLVRPGGLLVSRVVYPHGKSETEVWRAPDV